MSFSINAILMERSINGNTQTVHMIHFYLHSDVSRSICISSQMRFKPKYFHFIPNQPARILLSATEKHIKKYQVITTFYESNFVLFFLTTTKSLLDNSGTHAHCVFICVFHFSDGVLWLWTGAIKTCESSSCVSVWCFHFSFDSFYFRFLTISTHTFSLSLCLSLFYCSHSV